MQLPEIKLSKPMSLKTFNSKFLSMGAWFTYQKSKPLDKGNRET